MQNLNPTSKLDSDSKVNTQMNRETTSPNTGTAPRNTTTPPTSMPMDRGTPPNTKPLNRGTTPTTPNSRGSSPRPNVPMDRTMPPASGRPMDRTMPPASGRPMDRTTPPTSDRPMDRTMPPASGTPMNGSMPPASGAPMDRTMPPASGTPMNRTMPPVSGMPMDRTMPPASGMPMNNMPMGQMPMNGMTPGVNQPMNSIFMPNNTPYNSPMGVPLYPLYGYDNCEDLDRDMDYFKQLYPNSARRIQKEINNECDMLEYDGSVMFDEYPDRVTLDRIIDRIYERVQDMDETPQVEAKSFYYAPRRRQNLLRDFVSILLLNELFNRRRRYRSRRRWF